LNNGIPKKREIDFSGVRKNVKGEKDIGSTVEVSLYQ
jgi:hypothetical protein